MGTISLHYWAGAKAAAGTEFEVVEAGSIQAALDLVIARRDDARFRTVIAASSLLVNGSALHRDDRVRPVDGAVEVEILPPFAGGSTTARTSERHVE